MKTSDLLDLSKLKECEIIRFTLKEDTLSLLVVGDNEEEEHHHEDEEECDECCEGLNGHLFLLSFRGVKDYEVKGEECDNYKTKEVVLSDHHLLLDLEGNNFNEDDIDVKISYSYESFEVIDKGGIKGPDA